jgi:hypothetical protein
VRRRQRFRALRGDGEYFRDVIGIQRRMSQVGAFHMLHHDQHFAVVFYHVVDGGNVLQVQARGALRFFYQPLAITRVGAQMRRQALQHHRALQARVGGQVDLSHPPGAQAAIYFKPTYLGAGQIGHRKLAGWLRNRHPCRLACALAARLS